MILLPVKIAGILPALPGICVRYHGRHSVPPIRFKLPAAAPSLWSAVRKFSDGNREIGVYKAPRIDNSGPNPACLINEKVLPVILLDYGSESGSSERLGPVNCKERTHTSDYESPRFKVHEYSSNRFLISFSTSSAKQAKQLFQARVSLNSWALNRDCSRKWATSRTPDSSQ
jgi:hypothetical protein